MPLFTRQGSTAHPVDASADAPASVGGRWICLSLAMTAALVLLAFGTVGCKQGLGDRCQLNSDCDSGLVCVLPAGGSAAAGGTCQPSGQVADAGPADAGSDGVRVDQTGAPDRASADVTATDLGRPEARRPEARPPDARRIDSLPPPPDATPPDAKHPDAHDDATAPE